MKRALLLFAVLAFALPAFADSITFYGSLPRGPHIFDYMGGSRSANWRGTALSSTLSNLVLNSSTGLLTATSGVYDNRRYITGAYTQQLKIVSRGNLFGNYYTYGNAGSGNVKLTVQEPGTFGLLGIGLVFVGGVVRRKLKVG